MGSMKLPARVKAHHETTKNVLLHRWYIWVIILTVSEGYQSQNMSLFPFNPLLRGDFDHGNIMRPVYGHRYTPYHISMCICILINTPECVMYEVDIKGPYSRSTC